jgi:hypothetical protein
VLTLLDLVQKDRDDDLDFHLLFADDQFHLCVDDQFLANFFSIDLFGDYQRSVHVKLFQENQVSSKNKFHQ